MYISVIDNGGFTFGMDSVTPVTFKFSKKRRTRGVYTEWVLPNPNKALKDWISRLSNGEFSGSLNELKTQIRVLRSKED